MSLAQGIIGGAIAGLGQGMVNVEAEHRQYRGMKLQEQYWHQRRNRDHQLQLSLSGVQHGQAVDLQRQKDEAAQGRLDQELEFRENEMAVRYGQTERIADREFKRREKQDDRVFEEMQKQTGIEKERLGIAREQARKASDLHDLNSQIARLELDKAYLDHAAYKKMLEEGPPPPDPQDQIASFNFVAEHYMRLHELHPDKYTEEVVTDLIAFGQRYYRQNGEHVWMVNVEPRHLATAIQSGLVDVSQENWRSELLKTFQSYGFKIDLGKYGQYLMDHDVFVAVGESLGWPEDNEYIKNWQSGQKTGGSSFVPSGGGGTGGRPGLLMDPGSGYKKWPPYSGTGPLGSAPQ